MRENIDKAIEWLKEQPVRGCITGSSLLGDYWEGMDVDIFMYDEKSFIKLLYAMTYSKDFQILDRLDEWKYTQYTDKNYDNFNKFGLVTIKFTYNTCIPVNVILKKRCFDIFSVLSTFDMDIIARGYDIQTKQTLDLSENNGAKIATWNKWNTSYYDPELWQMDRMLRQLKRIFKYHQRGYNTDAVTKKYITIIDTIQNFPNIFSSENFTEKLKIRKKNTKLIKEVCITWLDTHEISDKTLDLLDTKINEI